MKLLGIVITYYPDSSELKKNISRFIDDVELLIIWENTPLSERDNFRISSSEFSEKIIYMGDKENLYIAYPLNRAVEYGLKNDFTHLLTMDQDSCFEPGHFRKYIKLISQYQNQYFIFGCNPNYLNQPISDYPVKVKTLITSGSFYDLKIFNKVGLFREEYKIDCIDYEFCFRSEKQGIYSYMIKSVLLNQQFGNLQKTKLGYHTFNYPPLRLYYIARNNIWLKREYKGLASEKDLIKWIVYPLIKVIFSEKNKWRKVKAIFKGIRDGVRCNFKGKSDINKANEEV
ncbi:MAG: hypothetical protein QM727_03985 [Niabella sp.]